MSFGPSSTGYEAPRAAEFLSTIRTSFVSALIARGLAGDVDWERDTFLGLITAIMADVLGQLGEASQGLYDAFDINNAVGTNLDSLCLIVAVRRLPATASQATVTATGTVGAVIPAGAVVRGGGPDDAALWTVAEPGYTVGGGGTVDMVVVCTEVGATVALAGTIDEIVSGFPGTVASVTNAADATPGEARESDSALRQRRQLALQPPGTRTLAGLWSTLIALDGVQAAVVIDNPTTGTVVTGGVTMVAHSLAVVVYPSTMTVDQLEEVVTAIYKATPAGIATNGAETGTVIGLDGLTKTVLYAFAATVAVPAAIVVTPDTGYTVADVTPGIVAVFADYALTLTVGSLVSRLELLALVNTVEGVKAVTYGSFTLNAVAADFQATNVQVPVLGVPTVS